MYGTVAENSASNLLHVNILVVKHLISRFTSAKQLTLESSAKEITEMFLQHFILSITLSAEAYTLSRLDDQV